MSQIKKTVITPHAARRSLSAPPHGCSEAAAARFSMVLLARGAPDR
jgi:hypothetical protein